MDIGTIIDLQKIHDPRGNLTVAEQLKDVPFEIKRAYWVYDVPAGTGLVLKGDAGVTYKVYKNTMMNFAFKGTPCEELSKHLEGTNAIAVSKDDATAPARILKQFAKKNPQLELIAGVVEGAYYDADGVNQLADVPTREVLLGRLFGSMQGPISSFARVLKQIADKQAEGAPAEAAEAPAAE